jgi:Protein of unknown function (DUF3667)
VSGHHNDENPSPYCLNCHYPMGSMDKFCPQCGQKATTGKVSVHDLVHELTHSIFHVDGKLFSTLKHLFVPGRLSVEFFRGHHKRYAHPIQMFIVLGGLCFAALAYLSHTQQEEQERLGNNAFPAYWGTPKDYQIRQELDSVKQVLNAQYKDPSVKSALDTLDKALTINTISSKDTDNLTFGFMFFKFNMQIANADLVRLTPDELIEKYEIKDKAVQKMLRQGLKVRKDNGRHLVDLLFGKMFWMFVLLLPLFGLVLALLYRRHRPKYYFVEHLIFLIHVHSFSFLSIGLLIFLAGRFRGTLNDQRIILWLFPFISLYGLLALKNFYRQSWGKTILKSLIIGLSYLVILFMGFGLTSMAVFFFA